MATPTPTGTPQGFNFTTSGTVVTYTGGGATGSNVYDVLAVNSDNVVTTPSGWTLITSKVNSQGSYLFYKAENGTTSATIALGGGIASATDVIWVRIQNSAGLDGATAGGANVDASSGNATPAFTSGTLGSATDLTLAFAALHATGVTPTAQVWSSGYTEQAFTSNATSPGVFGSVAVKTPAGTAAESPSMTWTNAANDRYLLFAAFSPSAGGGVTPTGIAATAALGSPATSNPESAAPSGVASSTALGTPAVSLNRSATPTGIACTTVLGQPNVSSTPGPSGIAVTAALGTPAVSLNLTTAPGGIASGVVLGQPGAGLLSGSPTGVSASVVLGTPTVSLGRTAGPTGLALVTALGNPSLVSSTTPSGISISASAGSPSSSGTVLTAGVPGSWYGLRSVDEENMRYLREERGVPASCPNDGEPLQRNPRTKLYQCNFDGYVWRGW